MFDRGRDPFSEQRSPLPAKSGVDTGTERRCACAQRTDKIVQLCEDPGDHHCWRGAGRLARRPCQRGLILDKGGGGPGPAADRLPHRVVGRAAEPLPLALPAHLPAEQLVEVKEVGIAAGQPGATEAGASLDQLGRRVLRQGGHG